MKENKKPIFFLIAKIIGFALVALGITLIIIGATTKVPSMGEDGWFNSETSKNGFIFGGLGSIILSIFFLLLGFQPSIAKLRVKSAKYIQSETKDDVKDIMNTSADISSDAVTTTVKAVKKGLKDTKFCKHCGAEIDIDSKFCNNCGKKL